MTGNQARPPKGRSYRGRSYRGRSYWGRSYRARSYGAGPASAGETSAGGTSAGETSAGGTRATRASTVAALLLLVPAIALSPALAPALAGAEIAGKPAIVDGDSLVIAGRLIRLYGIDAPESAQTCHAEGREWACGLEAGFALANLIGTNWVVCIERARDREGQVFAVCHAGGVGGPEVNAWLVSEGWALANRRQSLEYVDRERIAKAARKGLWRGAFTVPWEWRGDTD